MLQHSVDAKRKQTTERGLGFAYDPPGALDWWGSDVMAAAPAAIDTRPQRDARPDSLVCDALLDQDVFAGVGNIIKNERCSSWTTPPTRSTTGART